ncbi:LysR family transcriptional regulator [Phaeacidiphilus oryzae]|uniref:LysR family transcriptional regulator n=1 Tax=Phaeacidiphilus oryzae TaxID=348818 RepID=UPI0005697A0D|nr:LysR family transcriptional regulator [Phaeacidiphilus oryzae]
MNLTLRELEVFAAVGRAGSFTSAAGRLRVSQSALSRTVAAIEHRLHVRLLDRTTRTVALTPEGQEVLVVAERILAAHRAGMHEIGEFLAQEHGTVTVAALPSVAAVLLPSVVAAFHERYPGVEVRIRDGSAAAVSRRLAQGEADLAITVPQSLPPDVRHEPLVRDEFLAALPPGHPLAELPSVTWSRLAEERFVAFGRDSSLRMLTDLAFTAAGVSADEVVEAGSEAGSVATVGGMVAAGLGVTALPAMVGFLTSFADLRYLPVTEPAIHRRLDIVRPLHAQLTPAAARFLKLLTELRTTAGPPAPGTHWA